MLKVTLKLDDIIYTELMYKKEFELWKLTNKHIDILNVEEVEIQKIELIEKIKDRVKRYFECENLYADSSSQALFDILMLLQDYDNNK